MKSLVILTLLSCVSAWATTTTLKVKGMHCSGCVKMVTKSVCTDAEIKKVYGGCSVKMFDEKNQVGEITFQLPKNQKVDTQKIQVLLTATDETYKIIDANKK